MVALQTQSGELQWRTDLGGDISTAPVSDDFSVYIASEIKAAGKEPIPTTTSTLRSIAKMSGITLWARSLPAPIRTTLLINQSMVFVATLDGKIYALKKNTGEVVWVKNNNYPFNSHTVLSGDKLYIGDEFGNLHAIELNSGRTSWRYRTRGPLRAPVIVVNGLIFAGSEDTYIYAFSEKTGRLRWRSRAGAGIQSLVATPQHILATSLDNFVYCLSQRKGNKIWKRQLSGRILSQPLATSDGILFAPLTGDECVVLDPKDGEKINSINVGEENNTAAAPIQAGEKLLLTTRKGLIAYSNAQ